MNITVWNEGPGFSETQRSRLFRKFSRLDDPELKKKKGTGYRFVSRHGGSCSCIAAAPPPGRFEGNGPNSH